MAKITALVPSAGIGARLGVGLPKPYRCLGNRPILAYCLQTIQGCAEIEEIIIIVSARDFEFCHQQIIPDCNLTKSWQLIIGGSERQVSVYQGLRAITGQVDLVVIHDAVRPLVSMSVLEQCIAEAKVCGACIAGLPVRDTLKKVNENKIIEGTIDRSNLWLAQTPQVFRFDLLWKAHQAAIEDGFQGTDDAALVERLGIPVKIIQGSYTNIKITYPEDLKLVEYWLANEHENRYRV